MVGWFATRNFRSLQVSRGVVEARAREVRVFGEVSGEGGFAIFRLRGGVCILVGRGARNFRISEIFRMHM